MNQNDKLGWRGKVGLILPSANAVTEPLFYSLAPAGVAFYTSRTYVTDTTVEAVRAMEKEKDRAVRDLSGIGLNLIVDCCTMSGVLRGLEADRAFCKQVEEDTGVRTVSTVQAITEALSILRANRLVITSPYPEEADRAEKAFFEKNGFNVVNIKGLGIRGGGKASLVEPQEIYRLCVGAWKPGADCLFISCMNFNPTPVIPTLEAELKAPVISSNTATLWKILKALKVQEGIPGSGKLLSQG